MILIGRSAQLLILFHTKSDDRNDSFENFQDCQRLKDGGTKWDTIETTDINNDLLFSSSSALKPSA